MNTMMEKMISAVLALTALSITSVEIHREFFAAPQLMPGSRRPSGYAKDWRSMLRKATLIGDSAAPVTVLVFSDFQCPYCRKFNSALSLARRTYPNSIVTALIHLPLPGHAAANPAARASECAGRSGRFAAAVDFLYAKQDSIGKLPWTSLATAVGIKDTVGFLKCMADSVVALRVGEGAALAAGKSINATPTIFINGWRYAVPPADTELVRAIGDILKGKRPYKGFPRQELAAR